MNKKTLLAYSMLLAALAGQNVNGHPFFGKMEKRMRHMEQRMQRMFDEFDLMGRMFDDFADMDDDFDGIKFDEPRSEITITEKDGKAIVTIELGKDIEKFDADIKTKKAGFKMDQITIQTQKPKKQDIVINIVGNYLAVDQEVQEHIERKTEKPAQQAKTTTADSQIATDTNKQVADKKAEPKQQVQQYAASYRSYASQVGKTLSKKLDTAKAELEYVKKDGKLTIAIPYIKEAKKVGTKINVKIKAEPEEILEEEKQEDNQEEDDKDDDQRLGK